MAYNPLRVTLSNIIPLTEARDHFSQIVNEVQKDKLYILTKGGKPAVAIVDVKYLEQISGGNANTGQVEKEIQKNPTKVGLPEMISHAPKPADQPKPQPQPSAFHNDKPATPPAPKPQFDHQPPKPAFSTPAAAPKPENKPAPTPAQSSSSNNFWNEKPNTPIAPLPVKPVLHPNNPAAPQDKPATTAVIETSFSNQLDKQPDVKPEAAAKSLVMPTMAPDAAAPANTGSGTIDVHPIDDVDDEEPQNASQSDNSRVSPDDQPGPAQYAGQNAEPDDMMID